VTSPGEALFRPITVGGLTLPGRLFKTATSETRATDDGRIGPEFIAFYEPIARGGTPLIITGNLYVSPDGHSTPRQAGADHDDKIPGLGRLAEAVQAHGSRLFVQLSHCGRQVLPRAVGLPEAVSASPVKDLFTGTRPRALEPGEIARIVRDFAAAAARCREAGVDGVQIHAAHGYLLSQFLTPYVNRRGDAYGGSTEDRARLMVEVLDAVRDRVGPDYPMIVKLNGSDALPLRRGLGPEELVDVAVLAERHGADAVEVSVGHYESGFPVVRGTFWRCLRLFSRGAARDLPTVRRIALKVGWPVAAVACNLLWRPREGFNLDYARAFKRALSIPVVSVGGFRTREAMERAIDEGACDAVAVGRGLIADPFLYRHLREGTGGPRCVECNACVGHIGTRPVDCYHPRVRAEKDAMLEGDPGPGSMRPGDRD
jgi:2,4-dienoyl-CoA reductase-like NADH-dependent reductase (Old Yellow Enzyme family)